MAFDDLRSFLQALDDHGQLLKISEEVNAEPDLAAAANATGRIGDGAPALWFDNIRGFIDARVAMNTIGSWQNHAISLGLPPNTPVKKQIDEFIRRWDNFPIAPERRANPAWAQNTVDGDEINLFDILPLFRLNDGDGGFYLDKACVVSRDPLDPDNFGKQNVGIYRMEVKGKRKLGLQPVPMHDIALHLHKAEERGEDLPIAITLGNDPIITLMGATPLKYDQSEYEMAGALRESPYPIATAPLTGFDVPWGSEVILEGVIESRKREIEGPFGEFTGHYSGGRNMTVVRIDKVSYRTRPIFESLYLGMPWTEIDYLMGPATCVPLYQQLKAEFPEVQAVNAMYTHGLLAIISTKKRYGGFARAVGLRAMTTPHGLGYVKMVIMVDEDVDPFNLPQVMWALSSKVNPAGDLVQLPNMSVLELDPGSSPAGITDKLIIDATTPVAPDNRGVEFYSNVGAHRRMRAFAKLFTSRDVGEDDKKALKEIIMPIVMASMNMSRGKVGALIVIERAMPLDEIAVTGDQIDSNINQRLIENIFFKNSPLHDGAMIVSKKRIKAAGCILPVSHDMDIPKELGLRHRAAMGVSQESDAVAIVVSEETGGISVAVKGEFHLRLSAEELESILTKELEQ